VLNDLGVDIAALKREVQCYISVKPARAGPLWRRRTRLLSRQSG
jgi:hypothetical protein